MTTHQEIIAALKRRYAVNAFDLSKKVSDEDLRTILESGILAPSSFGLEPWKFVVVTDPEVRLKLRQVGFDQAKIVEASHLVVIAQRTDAEALVAERAARLAAATGKPAEAFDGFVRMAGGAVAGRPEDARQSWLKAQCYIPLGIMVETASLLGVDSAPMEGFMPDQVDVILGLKAKNLTAATFLALGYRAESAMTTPPKGRRPYEEAVETA